MYWHFTFEEVINFELIGNVLLQNTLLHSSIDVIKMKCFYHHISNMSISFCEFCFKSQLVNLYSQKLLKIEDVT